jgi:hypothetical protein
LFVEAIQRPERKNMKNIVVVVSVLFLSNMANAAGPIGLYTDPNIKWHGDFEAPGGGLAPGDNWTDAYCGPGVRDKWCKVQFVRPEQFQVVSDPVAQGNSALRVEVKYGDVMPQYSDQRSLLNASGVDQGWVTEGDEFWYRWQVYLPNDFVTDYPKWDQLGWDDASTTARSPSGYIGMEFHNGYPANPEPMYIGAFHNQFTVSLCKFNGGTPICPDYWELAPVVRGRWVDWLVHIKWSSNPSVGLFEIWMDPPQVGGTPLLSVSHETKWPGYDNWMIAGLYRNVHIGDQSLRYLSGQPVYGPGGTPGVIYLDGYAIGPTRDSVMSAGTLSCAPRNLVTNGNFAQSLTGWLNWDPNRIFAGVNEGRIAPGGPPDNPTARFVQQVSVLPYHNYRWSFQMRTDGFSLRLPNAWQQTFINDSGSGLARLPGQQIPFLPTQSYANYAYTFNSDASSSLIAYLGNWGGSDGNAYVTNVNLIDVTNNLLVNGDFSQGLTGWANWDVPRISVVAGEGKIVGGTPPENARFFQEPIVQPNHNYRLSFRMRTDNVTPGNFAAQVYDPGVVNRLAGGYLNPSPTQGLTDYTYTFNSGANSTVKVYIGCWGNTTGAAYISQVSLVDITTPAAPSITNGNFASGLTGWYNWDNRVVADVNAARLNPGDATNPLARLVQDVANVSTNRTYQISFQVKTQGITLGSGYFLFLALDPTHADVNRVNGPSVFYPASTQDWTTYTFTANTQDGSALRIYIGNWDGFTGGSAYVTNVTITDVTP